MHAYQVRDEVVTAPSGQENGLMRQMRRIQGLPLPASVRRKLVSFAAGFAVPYLRTSAVQFESVQAERVTLSLRNLRKVQNHMKTVHASAMFLLAEAATGAVLLANLPDGAHFSTTRSEVEYRAKAVGRLEAVASLSPEQQRMVREQEKGRLIIPVVLTDAEGKEPAFFTIEWSWKHRKPPALASSAS